MHQLEQLCLVQPDARNSAGSSERRICTGRWCDHRRFGQRRVRLHLRPVSWERTDTATG